MIKRTIKKLLFWFKQLLSFKYKILLYLKIVAPKMIVKMDGGISSQMHQYLLGRIYGEKGYIVTYDLSFFQHWSKDNNGDFERNFDLLKAFPYLEFKQSGSIERMVYPLRFADKSIYLDHEGEDVFLYGFKPPKYLGGYYRSPREVWKDLFPKYFHVDPHVLDNYSYAIYTEIENTACAVGIHVRRGDLKIFNGAYGPPADFEYFSKAVAYLCSKVDTPFFYFFSDEPQWVKDELVEKLPMTSAQYKIVDSNGSDKGYMDLFLLSACRHQITSKGSFGKFGALLADSKDKIVVLNNDPVEYVWKDRLINPVFL